MARVEIPLVVSKATGSVSGAVASYAVSGASVLINIRGQGPATVYAGESGATTLANPLTTGAEGRIDGWVDEGSYDLVISGAGISTYSQPFEATRGDGTSRVAANAVGTTQLQAASVTFAKLAADVIANLIPTGVIWPYAGTTNTPPTGWAFCDGAPLNGTIAQYTPLWNVIGTTYGGTGQSSFAVPDLRGRVPVGADAMTGVAANIVTANAAVGNKQGFEKITLAAVESGVASHGHLDNITYAGSGLHQHALTINPSLVISSGSWLPFASGATWVAGFEIGTGSTFNAAFPKPTSGSSIGGTQGSHAHTGVSDTEPNHTHTRSGGVTSHPGAPAANPHNNMQPSLMVKYIIKL